MSESTQLLSEDALNMDNIPAPAGGPINDNDVELKNKEITADVLLDDILKKDEDGHTDAQICFSLEKLHHVKEGMALEDLPEEDREWISDLAIEDCNVDIYSMDGEITCLNLVFDTPKSVYLRELNEYINRYRIFQEELLEDENRDPEDMLMLSALIMPNTAEYQAILQFSFPFWWGRVVGDDGSTNTITIMFHSNNVEAYQADLTEEQLIEMKADVLREMETGTGGAIFEDQ